jgi:hypothetical protein
MYHMTIITQTFEHNIFFSESGPINHTQLLEDGLPAGHIYRREEPVKKISSVSFFDKETLIKLHELFPLGAEATL